MRTESDIKHDIRDCEEILARLVERQSRLQGHLDSLRGELIELTGAASDRYVGAR
jgi:hypothetical protein